MNEPEFEPFDDAELVGLGTTAQDQSNLKAKAANQATPPKAMRIHELPAVYKRPDTDARRSVAILRDDIVQKLMGDDPNLRAQDAVLYVDLWLEYVEASDSIDANGMICLHPRTPVIIENPYMPRRDKTRAALAQIRNVDAPWLWMARNIDRARQWLDQATAEREARLTPGERHRKNLMEGTKQP
jgi:hypothetical protein